MKKEKKQKRKEEKNERRNKKKEKQQRRNEGKNEGGAQIPLTVFSCGSSGFVPAPNHLMLLNIIEASRQFQDLIVSRRPSNHPPSSS
jgi:hypothetical protein